MKKVIIIEDEINVRSALKKMLHILEPSIKVVAETGLVTEAGLLISAIKPDIVFLDIELEDGTGFDLLNQFNKTDFKVIFTTAYNEYAITAFKYSAVDYLLKPIDPDELKEALGRAITSIESEREHQELLDVLKNNVEKKEAKIVLNTSEQRYILKVNDIIRLEADGAYTTFITVDKKIVVSKSIKHYENILDEKFIRCHQSHLIHSKHIDSQDKNNFIMMSNKDEIPVSTRKQSAIKKLIAKL